MKIDLYDVDDEAHIDDLSRHDFLGQAEFVLGNLFKEKAQTLKLALQHNKRAKNGFAILQAEQHKARLSSNVVKLMIEGNGLKSTGSLFYKLLRLKDGSDKEFVPVYQSETSKSDNGKHKFRMLRMGTATLFKDDENKPLQIELYEYKRNGSHILKGFHQFTFRECLDNFKWTIDSGYFPYNIRRGGSYEKC